MKAPRELSSLVCGRRYLRFSRVKETSQWTSVFDHQLEPLLVAEPLAIEIHFWNAGSNSSSWERSA